MYFDRHHEHYSDRELLFEILRVLHRLEEKIDNMTVSLEALEAAVGVLDAEEHAAAEAFAALAEEIKNLEAGSVSQAQIDAITAHATAVAEALKAATPEPAPAPEPSPEPAPEPAPEE